MDYFIIAAQRYGPSLFYSTETFERIHSTVRKLSKNSNFTRPLYDLVSNARRILIQHTKISLTPKLFQAAAFIQPHAQYPIDEADFGADLLMLIRKAHRLFETTPFSINYRYSHTSVSMARFGSNRLHALCYVSEQKKHNCSKSVVSLWNGTTAVVQEIRSFQVKITASQAKYFNVWMKVIKLEEMVGHTFTMTNIAEWIPLSINTGETDLKQPAEPRLLLRGLVWQELGKNHKRLCGSPQYIVPHQ